MKIVQWLQDTVPSILKRVVRIFPPTGDNYPQTGVQLFEGEPYDEGRQSAQSWITMVFARREF